jgi:hypothetical protein
VSSGFASGLHSTGCACAAMHDPMPRTDHLAQAMPPDEAAPLELVTNAKRVCAATGAGVPGTGGAEPMRNEQGVGDPSPGADVGPRGA